MSEDPLKNLSPRKRKYVKARASGKTKKDSALAAGYSEETAKKVKSHIETPEVRAAFQKLIRKHIPASKVVKRIQEGMDAMETKFFQKDGIVTDSRDVISYSERRAYAELVAEYGGYHIPKAEVTGENGGPIVFKLNRMDKQSANPN